MEIAFGVGFEDNMFVGHSVARSGEMTTFPLEDLHDRGLPKASSTKRRRIDTNFAQWREVGAREYLEAHGFSLPDAVVTDLQIFEAEVDGRRFVIPALALMRALFRPAKHLLPMMFRPQALDQVGQMEASAEGLTFKVDAPWATKGLAGRCVDWSTALNWMFFYPSAFKMAGSVHQNARTGRIALALPTAEARIVCTGLEFGRTLFVTEASVMSVLPLDAAIHDLAGLPRTISLHQGTLNKCTRYGHASERTSVHLHPDGTSNVSDAEWVEIERLIMAAREREKPFKLSQRDLLDGVLQKLATNASWRGVDYKVGTWVNASAAFQRWTKRGTLAAILGVLEESRSTPQ